jgi:hypothetical protein
MTENIYALSFLNPLGDQVMVHMGRRTDDLLFVSIDERDLASRVATYLNNPINSFNTRPIAINIGSMIESGIIKKGNLEYID